MSWEHDAVSDSALVTAVSDGSHEALGELYRRHSGPVWSVARQVCPNTELAEQVCASVFTELWSHPERFDPSRDVLRSWLVAQAHLRAVDAARSDPAGPNLKGDGYTSPALSSVEVALATHAEALGKEARKALDQLAPAERDAILLAYFGSHTCVEVARLLGTSEGTVRRHIRRGLLNLRRALDVEEVTR